MTKKFKYGIFDLDGNIVDAMGGYKKVFCAILKDRFGIAEDKSVKYYLESAGTPIEVQFERMLKENGKPLDEVPQMVKEFFDAVNEMDFELFDGAEDVISRLHGAGIKLFVTTGSRTDVTEERLRRKNILKYFALVMGSSEIPKGPEHVERFAAHEGLSVSEFSLLTFYCGDGPRDMEIAKACGIYAIAVAQTVSKGKLLNAGADIIVDKISQVTELAVFN